MNNQISGGLSFMWYKKWTEISGVVDYHLMMGLALLDLTTEFGQSIAKALPQFFTRDQPDQQWPIPLSVLRAVAKENSIREGSESPGHLASNGALQQFGIPYSEFGLKDNGYSEAPPLPENVAEYAEASVGTIFNWDGALVVVVERVGGDWICFSPAECIDVTK